MLLVTGATGHVGRELVRALAGVPFRTMSRTPTPGERHVVADLDNPASLAQAFAGVDRMFLLTPGTGTTQTVNALEAAHRAGVSHIVHLSSSNVLGNPMPAMGRWHHEREELIRASGIPATVLRPGGFMTNALDWADTIRTGGYVLDPVGPGRFAPVDPADIADVAAKILNDSRSKPPSQVPWPLPRQSRPSGRDGTAPRGPGENETAASGTGAGGTASGAAASGVALGGAALSGAALSGSAASGTGAGGTAVSGVAAYILTGGEALTVAEQVHILGNALGRELEVRATATPEEAVRSRFPHGAPQALADALVEGLALMRADTTGLVTDTVQDLTGHAPRTFADWCARNTAAFSR